jgi:hypothetical protein
MKEQQVQIKTFLKNLVDKNYKEANAELHNLVEIKLKDRVKQAAAQKK